MGYTNFADVDDEISMTASQKSNGMHNKHGSDVNDVDGQEIERFDYFEIPQFSDELTHYEYIMQKYVKDSACLQINISGGLRSDAHRMPAVNTALHTPDSEEILKLFNNIRAELWQLMRDSYTRFRATADYKKLCELLANKPEFQNTLNRHQNRPRIHEYPPSLDYNIKNNVEHLDTHLDINKHFEYGNGIELRMIKRDSSSEEAKMSLSIVVSLDRV